jgi:thymidylate kinase
VTRVHRGAPTVHTAPSDGATFPPPAPRGAASSPVLSAPAPARWGRHRRHFPGLWVAVLGSDGSGKSTLIHGLRRNFATAFPETVVFHLRPGLIGRPATAGPITDPHGRPAHPWWWSCVKVFYYIIVYNVAYLARIRPSLRRSALVLCDRYFDDLLVDPRRYRYGGPIRLASRARRFIPRPDLFLILDVPEAQLLQRKQEVALAELRRQRAAYRQLEADTGGAVLLDGSRPAEEVAQRACCVIARYLGQPRGDERRVGR